jgi:hypothetical protein
VLALVGIGAAAAFGRGSRPVTLRLNDGGGWVTSERFGLLFHVNGPSGRADAAITLPGAAGHQLDVLTGFAAVPAAPAASGAPPTAPFGPPGSPATTASTAAAGGGTADGTGWPADDAEAAVVVDTVSGTVWRIDASLLAVTASVSYPPGTVVSAADGAGYAVDPAGGIVLRIDPRTLAQLGPPLTFPRGLGAVAQTPDGTLWVPVPSAGTVVPVRTGAPGRPVAAAPAGDRIDVVVAGGTPVVFDRTAGTLTRLVAGRATAAVHLPVGGSAGWADLLVTARTEGQVLALAWPTAGQLLLADLVAGTVRAATLPAAAPPAAAADAAGAPPSVGAGAGDRLLGAPVWAGGQVYVPDSDADVVWDYDPVTGRYGTPVAVAPAGGRVLITTSVQDGQLWINDETGPDVVLVTGAGRRDIVKFGAALPGGDHTSSPRPLPPGATPGPPPTTAPGRGQVWPGWGRPGPGDQSGTARDGGGSRGGGGGKNGSGRGGNGRGGGQPGQAGEGRPGTTGSRGGGEQPTSQPTAPIPTAAEPTPTAQPGQPGGTGGPGGGTAPQSQALGPVGSPTVLGGSPAGEPAQPAATPAPGAGPTAGSGGSPVQPAVPTAAPGRVPTPAAAGAPPPPGYWLLTAGGSVLARGTAGAVTAGAPDPGAVAIVPTATGRGYWLVDASGTGHPAGDAPAVAAAGSGVVVAAAAGPTGGGYWTVTAAGIVAAHGSLAAYGSLGDAPAAPVVGIAATPTGGGYWLVDAAGGVHPFGDAAAIAPGVTGTGPATGLGRTVGIAASPTGSGYWTVTAAGVVTAHGSASRYGSPGSVTAAVVALAATPTGRGYWVVDAVGHVWALGDATAGADSPAGAGIVAVAAVPG